ncbi:hypothetical protein PPERSA_08083 [Pseudocohnilembus persalinus]|uniref:Uncharacterized protein n=1 Tax=Pseudocohnilembus persalinus TaxID=266149 RepID=A0A0V0R2P4_PSEPJ|nr:hypothetical protein PPERSA_08083 [Pseudocohnilembus persalinus]|eukprot:KRX08772.1 hypothetical protein PPERSA_08083 [Pseudocohnilembus persalinus]
MGCTTSKQGQKYDIRVKKKSKQSTGETNQYDWPQFKIGSNNDYVTSEEFCKNSDEDKHVDYEAKDFQILQQIINQYSRKNSIEEQEGYKNFQDSNNNQKIEVQLGSYIKENSQTIINQEQQQNSDKEILQDMLGKRSSTKGYLDNKIDNQNEEDDYFPVFEDDDNIQINYQQQKYQFCNKKKQADKKVVEKVKFQNNGLRKKYFSQQFHRRNRSANINLNDQNKYHEQGQLEKKIKVIQMKGFILKNIESMFQQQQFQADFNYDQQEKNQLQSLGQIIPKYRVSYNYLSELKKLKQQNYQATPMLLQKIDKSFLMIKRQIHSNFKQLKEKENLIIKYNKSYSSNDQNLNSKMGCQSSKGSLIKKAPKKLTSITKMTSQYNLNVQVDEENSENNYQKKEVEQSGIIKKKESLNQKVSKRANLNVPENQSYSTETGQQYSVKFNEQQSSKKKNQRLSVAQEADNNSFQNMFSSSYAKSEQLKTNYTKSNLNNIKIININEQKEQINQQNQHEINNLQYDQLQLKFNYSNNKNDSSQLQTPSKFKNIKQNLAKSDCKNFQNKIVKPSFHQQSNIQLLYNNNNNEEQKPKQKPNISSLDKQQLLQLSKILPKYKPSHKYFLDLKKFRKFDYQATPQLYQSLQQSQIIKKRQVHQKCKLIKQRQEELLQNYIQNNRQSMALSSQDKRHQLEQFLNQTNMLKMVENQQLRKIYSLV